MSPWLPLTLVKKLSGQWKRDRKRKWQLISRGHNETCENREDIELLGLTTNMSHWSEFSKILQRILSVECSMFMEGMESIFLKDMNGLLREWYSWYKHYIVLDHSMVICRWVSSKVKARWWVLVLLLSHMVSCLKSSRYRDGSLVTRLRNFCLRVS